MYRLNGPWVQDTLRSTEKLMSRGYEGLPLKENLNFETAINQLKDSPVNCTIQQVFSSGVQTEARLYIQRDHAAGI